MSDLKSSISLRDLIEILFRHKKVILTVIPVVVLIAIAATLLTHKVYSSEMKFLVQNSRGNIIISAEKTTAANTVNDVTEQQINSELEILYSKDVVEPVADPTWNADKAADRTPEEVSLHEKRVRDFQQRLSAEPTRKSNVINVSVTGATPTEAQAALLRLSTAYLAEHRRLQRPVGASEFFSSEADRYRRAWDDATQKLVQFQQEHQLVSISDQQTSLEKDISTTQASLRDADTGLQELNGRLKMDASKLRETSQRQVTQRKALPNQQSVQQLSGLVVELQNKRTALLTQFRPDDRLIKEIDQQIAQTESALNKATSGSSEEVTSDVDPAWQQVRLAYVTDQIRHEAYLQQRNALTQHIAALQKRMAEVQELTVPFNLLQSRAENLKEDYQLYMQKRDQALIEDAMDERKLLNVAIAQNPTLSYTPLKPKPLTNIALGFVTAIFLAFACVYGAEMTRSTLSTPRELEAFTHFPVLATLPFSTRLIEGMSLNPIPPSSVRPVAQPIARKDNA